MTRPALARLALTAACALALGACGNDDSSSEREAPPAGTNLGAIKDYLLSHTERLVADSAAVRRNAEDYYALARSVDFD